MPNRWSTTPFEPAVQSWLFGAWNAISYPPNGVPVPDAAGGGAERRGGETTVKR
jgi:hypothetical protein